MISFPAYKSQPRKTPDTIFPMNNYQEAMREFRRQAAIKVAEDAMKEKNNKEVVEGKPGVAAAQTHALADRATNACGFADRFPDSDTQFYMEL